MVKCEPRFWISRRVALAGKPASATTRTVSAQAGATNCRSIYRNRALAV